MSTPDPLVNLLQTLDARQFRYAELSMYHEGEQELSFLAPEAREALRNRLARMNVNICRLAIQSVVERLRVAGFENDDRVWNWWLRNELDLESEMAHRECLLYGASYALVSQFPDGSPRVTIESARQVTVAANPADRSITSGCKRYYADGATHVWWYLPDQIQHWAANTVSAANTALELVEVFDNSIGAVPVVQFRNAGRIPVSHVAYPDRLLDHGTSDLQDLIPLVDLLAKQLADLAVVSELLAAPARFLTGISSLPQVPKLDEHGQTIVDGDGNPVMEAISPFEFVERINKSRTLFSTEDNAKFGQLPGASLDNFESSVRVIMSAIQAVSCLPASYLGILSDQPNSADALRAASAGLTARAESKQRSLGRGWTRVAQLMVAAQDGVDPDSVDVRVKWSPADYRSMAEEADATAKLSSLPLYSRETALRKLGMSEDEVTAEIERLEAEMTSVEYSKLNAYSRSASSNWGSNGAGG